MMEFKIWSCFFIILLVSSCSEAGRTKSKGAVYSRPSSGGHYQPHPAPAAAPPPGWNVPHHQPAHTATHYNPSQSYSPSGGYHPPPNTGYHPPNTGYHPPPAQAPQTIIVESEKRGIGTIAKEAAVGAVISAGVNAAADRIIPGGIYGNSNHGHAAAPAPVAAPAAPGVSHTEIVYNNYYGNGTGPAPGDPGQAPPNPAVPQQYSGQYPAQVPNGNYYGQPQTSVTYRANNADTISISKCGLIFVTILMYVFAKNF